VSGFAADSSRLHVLVCLQRRSLGRLELFNLNVTGRDGLKRERERRERERVGEGGRLKTDYRTAKTGNILTDIRF